MKRGNWRDNVIEIVGPQRDVEAVWSLPLFEVRGDWSSEWLDRSARGLSGHYGARQWAAFLRRLIRVRQAEFTM
jgi:hypothetical protein